MAQRKAAPPGRPGSGRSSGTAAKRPATNRPAKPGDPAGKPPAANSATPATPAVTPPKADTTKADTTKADTTKADTTKGAVPARTATAARTGAARGGAAKGQGRPPARKPGKPGKSIVNQKQRPWGLIATTVAIVAFAAAIIVVVIATRKTDTGSTSTTAGGQQVDAADPYRQPALAAAMAIKGVTYRVEGQHTHVDGHIKYDSSPPVGGNHSQYWADCTGTVYAKAIANENAVHMLEHGAVWITYNSQTLPASGVATLAKFVSGQDRMAMSPYPNLKTPISLQSWGYQLFVSSPSDPRIAQFISTVRFNKKTTPEYGATCSQPTFKTNPSTYGHPLWVPANGATGNTSGR